MPLICGRRDRTDATCSTCSSSFPNTRLCRLCFPCSRSHILSCSGGTWPVSCKFRKRSPMRYPRHQKRYPPGPRGRLPERMSVRQSEKSIEFFSYPTSMTASPRGRGPRFAIENEHRAQASWTPDGFIGGSQREQCAELLSFCFAAPSAEHTESGRSTPPRAGAQARRHAPARPALPPGGRSIGKAGPADRYNIFRFR